VTFFAIGAALPSRPLSGRLHIQVANDAKAKGWNIGLVYIGLGNAEIAIARIRERTMAGGHHVPAADVRRRFERSLQNLAAIYSFANLVLLFDNSSTRNKMRKIFESRRGDVVFSAARLPGWARRSLGAIIGSGQSKP